LLQSIAAAAKTDLRSCIRIATWNILTITKTGYPDTITRELSRLSIMIAGLTETRILQSRELDVGEQNCTNVVGQLCFMMYAECGWLAWL